LDVYRRFEGIYCLCFLVGWCSCNDLDLKSSVRISVGTPTLLTEILWCLSTSRQILGHCLYYVKYTSVKILSSSLFIGQPIFRHSVSLIWILKAS
jgi:hypothetical protein